ncbi:MAG TPA: hypothetical protein PLJ47_03070 [Candidatus Hydrogenedentes bacterium]|nr:hypothetical protein [Candidatus Hydrogenedentota bacterium]HRK33553.1 hypothetical protein [Candidatus Hydrogenedentota bacterium]
MVELSAAIFVLTLGLLGVAKLCQFGLDRLRWLEEQSIAVQAVQNEIETLRALPFERLAAGEHDFVSVSPSLLRLSDRYEARVLISEYPHAAQVKEVTASIIWLTENARRTERTVTTLIAEKRP